MLVTLTDFDGRFSEVMADVGERTSTERIQVDVDSEREAGRGYYPGLCFRIGVDVGDEVVDLGDGGFVDWAAVLLGSRKERLLIGGLSLERLAMV